MVAELFITTSGDHLEKKSHRLMHFLQTQGIKYQHRAHSNEKDAQNTGNLIGLLQWRVHNNESKHTGQDAKKKNKHPTPDFITRQNGHDNFGDGNEQDPNADDKRESDKTQEGIKHQNDPKQIINNTFHQHTSFFKYKADM